MSELQHIIPSNLHDSNTFLLLHAIYQIFVGTVFLSNCVPVIVHVIQLSGLCRLNEEISRSVSFKSR